MNDYTKPVADVVADLTAAGIFLWTEAGQLRFRAPAGALSSGQRAMLKARREAFVAHLTPVAAGITTDPLNRYEPFPLTDLQLAYIVGRRDNYELGGVGCHNYLELQLPPLDPQRLERAWHALIMRHDMLRAEIGTDGQQRVLKTVALPPLHCDDLHGASAEAFERAVLLSRDEMAFRRYDAERWPLYEVRLTLHDDCSILHYSTDLLIADFASIQLLLAELGQLYHHPDVPLAPIALTFRDVVVSERARRQRPDARARLQKHRDYWMRRLPGLPGAPELPTLPYTARTNQHAQSFERHSFDLPVDAWKRFCAIATELQLTPTSAVMGAFIEVLRLWSRQPDFCINLTLFNRPAAHDQIQQIVGDFIAVNVLEARGDSGATFLQRAKALQWRLWQDIEHSEFSGIDVLRQLSRMHGSNQLVPVVFTSTLGIAGQGLPRNEFMHDATLRYGITQTPQVWLDCQATERGGALHVDWDVRTGIFPDGLIEQAFAAFTQAIESLAQDRNTWDAARLAALPDATRVQRERINHERDAPLPAGFLHGGFCRHALASPERPALLSGDDCWSYGQLAAWAVAIARSLRAAGCTPGEPVALFLDKGPAQIAAILGVLLAEGAYVPIDVGQPTERRNIMLADVKIRLLLTDRQHLDSGWPAGIRPILVEPAARLPAANVKSALQEAIEIGARRDTAAQLVYVLYTSGTTGRPKGVMLSHQGVLNTIAGFNRQFGIDQDDRLFGLVNYTFDLSVLDIFCAYTAGAALVLPQGQWRNDPEQWASAIERHRATVWNSVPAHMQMLLSHPAQGAALSSLRMGFLSGDWIPVTLPDQVRMRVPGLMLRSLGGPTEISVACIYHDIRDVRLEAVSIPYGSPLSNHRLYVLDGQLEHRPDWTPGEMYVGGPGVALGFVNDPERTRERFVTHPRTGERLYRTGDICRFRNDGVIEILGREDNQVKIRGHRIELGDVEAALASLPGVGRAVALVRRKPLDLVAAVEAAEAVEAVEAADPRREPAATLAERLGRGLAARLPRYMLPAAIEVLPRIPLSRNGKVDRQALADIFEAGAAGIRNHEPPRDEPLEQKMAAIWRELTLATDISRNDDFFMIGGTSLTAVELLNRLSSEGFRVNIDLIFNHPVFHDMVSALKRAEDEEASFRQRIDLDALLANATRNLDSARPELPSTPVRNLFLTGATGYLGIYVLRALLHTTDARIHCLVRCRDDENGYLRLRQMIDEKGLGFDLDRERVRIVPGDLAAERFGLDDAAYATLARDMDQILHVAAMISLIAPLSAAYPINVLGCANVIELACTGKRKPIHHMSTVGVHCRLPYGESEAPIAEATGPDAPWHKPELTYEHTKYMAEQLFHRARQQGVKVNIFRSGAITWDSEQNPPFINDDAFVKFFRTCVSVQGYPDASILISITPVNVIARYIGMIAGRDIVDHGQNFHLVSQHSLPGRDIYTWFNEMGCRFAAMDFDTWRERLQDSFGRGFINRYFKHGIGQSGHHQYRIDNLMSVLNEHGMEPNRVDRAYFEPLLSQMAGATHGSEGGIACAPN
ncbi:non-ribosomal peptide synthetase [Burkholderia guangdongensis]|uniref:non-ribosomal peptide synthetase n=1 Tax=Burkholderia guangdongensis TaxID=1792500 RepID=UPI0015CA4B5A|nr:non-ribosomal peptide synthetase [Burkholderia guangdongensis]